MTDQGTNSADIFNNKYQLVEQITSGISVPVSDWYDGKGNLYVVNPAGTVQEYGPGSTTPIFTYSESLDYPFGVTTDAAGNVYVANFADDKASTVVEFAQQSNVVAHSCDTGRANEGVAVDSNGDVFVTGNIYPSGPASIIEYPAGLINCNRVVLGATVSYAAGLQIDNKEELVVADPLAGTVDIIAPPYTSIKSTIGGFKTPHWVALNKKQNQVFVADVGNKNVVIDTYPGGKTLQTLGAANGLQVPSAVATYPFAKK